MLDAGAFPTIKHLFSKQLQDCGRNVELVVQGLQALAAAGDAGPPQHERHARVSWSAARWSTYTFSSPRSSP